MGKFNYRGFMQGYWFYAIFNGKVIDIDSFYYNYVPSPAELEQDLENYVLEVETVYNYEHFTYSKHWTGKIEPIMEEEHEDYYNC